MPRKPGRQKIKTALYQAIHAFLCWKTGHTFPAVSLETDMKRYVRTGPISTLFTPPDRYKFPLWVTVKRKGARSALETESETETVAENEIQVFLGPRVKTIKAITDAILANGTLTEADVAAICIATKAQGHA